jgi:hypothetical protein
MWDKALVLLTADHGVGWTPGEKPRSLGVRNAPNLMWVPLFVKAPHQRQGRIDDRNWEQVDLLPTVADLLGVRVPWKMDGLSQNGPPARRRGEKWWFDIPGHREVRDGPPNLSIVLQGETDSLVRASEGVKGLYRFGAFAGLVYRDPATVGPIGGAPARAELDDWKLYGRIDPGSGTVPALVSGELTSPLPPAGSTVLVAVNGKIAGESKLFPERPGRAGRQVRRDRARLAVPARRRAPPAPGLRGRPERRRPPPAARHPVGRVGLRSGPSGQGHQPLLAPVMAGGRRSGPSACASKPTTTSPGA